MTNPRFPTTFVLVIGLLLLAGLIAWIGRGADLAPYDVKNEAPAADFSKIPLHFEENVGQASDEVKFLSHESGYSLFLTAADAVLVLQKPVKDGEQHRSDKLRLSFADAHPSPKIAGEDRLEGKTNYLLGDDPGEWKTDIANFGRVRYSNVIDGVDVVYYGRDQQLEYDLVVSPNALPDSIKLRFDGAEDLSVSENGDLIFDLDGNKVVQHKPIAYQEIDGQRKEVAASYTISNPEFEISDLKSVSSESKFNPSNSTIGFTLGDYDRSQPLVIDPVLTYSTYLGGTGDSFGTSIAVDQSGSAYVTGYTDALDFPTISSFQQANNGGTAGFITKLNPAGTAFVYSTYLGGNSRTFPSSIKVDAAGSAYVGGWTLSSNFPTTPGAYRSTSYGGGRPSFITKLSPNGASLSYSTYLGPVSDLTGIAPRLIGQRLRHRIHAGRILHLQRREHIKRRSATA